MNTNTLWAIIGLVVIIGGGFWYVNSRAGSDSALKAEESTLGSYAYTCANGSQFTMTPSDDMSSVQVTAGSQGMFTGTVTLAKVASTAGQRYEGGNIIFVGAGEEVQLTVGTESTICNPKFNPDSPPWNWGDAGEGGGVKQDAALIVSESILGKWQSTTDAKFTREFKAGNAVEDRYDNEVVSSGLWVAFEKGIQAPEVPFPLADNVIYIQMTMSGTQADTLNFKLTKLTPEELELIYMDRGGVLQFKKVQ